MSVRELKVKKRKLLNLIKEGCIMPVKRNLKAKMFHVINSTKSGTVIKPTPVYLAIRKQEKDLAFTFTARDKIVSFATHLSAYNHKEAWSIKYLFNEVFEKCKEHGISDVRVYIANVSVFEKTQEIALNLSRIAAGYGLTKLDVYLIQDGEYTAEYQIAENAIYRMNKKGEAELLQINDKLDDFNLDLKHQRDYQPKLLFKKPLFVGKNHAEHNKERLVGLKTHSHGHERNFKNVMIEMLEMEASIKQKTKEAMKYVNDVLHRDSLGYIELDSSTLQEWTMDWVEMLSLDKKDLISITALENYLLNKVALAKSYLDRRSRSNGQVQTNCFNYKPILSCAV